jgi:hypothetical protein
MMDLSHLSPDWEGWYFHERRLYAPEWRKGLTASEIRALPYPYALEAETDRQRKEVEALKRQTDALARLAGWYRRQLSRESKLGLMLSRLSP